MMLSLSLSRYHRVPLLSSTYSLLLYSLSLFFPFPLFILLLFSFSPLRSWSWCEQFIELNRLLAVRILSRVKEEDGLTFLIYEREKHDFVRGLSKGFRRARYISYCQRHFCSVLMVTGLYILLVSLKRTRNEPREGIARWYLLVSFSRLWK